MNSLALELVAGLSTGGIYALLALGLTLIYQVSGVVNFAQGALAAAGAYVLWSLINQAGLAFWPAVAVGAAIVFLLGALLQAVVLQRLQRAPAASVIVTLGLLIVLEGLIGWHWGYNPPSVDTGGIPLPQPLSLPVPAGQVTLASVSVSNLDLTSIGAAVLLILSFFGFLRYTRAGAAVRAVAQSAQGARLVGIRIDRVRLMAWGISAIIAAAAGVLITTAKFTPMSPSMAETYLLSAFAGAVIGGLDSLVGAAIGALLIGVLQNLVAFYISTEWKDAVVFLLLLVVLLIRPAGVFGVAVQRRV